MKNERNAGRKKKTNEPYTVRCHPKVIQDVRKYAKEKTDIQNEATQDEKLANAANNQANMYNYAQGFFQISIILAAIGLLIKKRYMWFLSMALGATGTLISAYAFMM